MSKFSIDGKDFVGRNITIRNGRVTIDGVTVEGTVNGVVEIRVTEGKIDNLTTDAEVNCGDVTGNVKAGMSVTCGNVGGTVDAGMSVTCQDVHGNIDAGMGVTYRGRR